MNKRQIKQLESKVDISVKAIKEDLKDGQPLTCILSNYGFMYVSEYEFAKKRLKENYNIEDNNTYL